MDAPSAPKYTQGLAERSRNLDDSVEIRIHGNGVWIPPKGRKQFREGSSSPRFNRFGIAIDLLIL
jgi:hypothetical protein